MWDWILSLFGGGGKEAGAMTGALGPQSGGSKPGAASKAATDQAAQQFSQQGQGAFGGFTGPTNPAMNQSNPQSTVGLEELRKLLASFQSPTKPPQA